MALSGLRGWRGRGRRRPPRCPLPFLCPPRGPAPAPPRPRAIDRASFGMPAAAVSIKLGPRWPPPPHRPLSWPPSSSPNSRRGRPVQKPPPWRDWRCGERRGRDWRGRTRRPGVHFESLKLKSGGRGRAGEEGAGGCGKKDGCSRGSAPGRGRPAGREGWDECINPFLAVPRPPSPAARARPPGPRPRSGVEASIPAGGWGGGARPRRSRGVRGGRGPRPGITILIALMPFLEGEGLEDPSPLSTKMFNHCMESNQILSLKKKKSATKSGTV